MNISPDQCQICKGAGYLRADVPYGHPQFGKPIACSCKQAEWTEKRKQQLAAISNLEAFSDKVFNSYNFRMPGVQEAYQQARAFARSPQGWLLLVGQCGCGKTHLAAAIANECLHQDKTVLFVNTPDLLDHLRATFSPASPVSYDELFCRVRELEVLVLDDLGAGQLTPWAGEKLYQLVNHRYTLQLPTVITANADGLNALDERVRSRLSDKSLVLAIVMDHAEDYRPHNRSKLKQEIALTANSNVAKSKRPTTGKL